MAAEDVCIILNEREPAKVRLTETLLSKLKQLEVSVCRLKPDPKLERIIKQRAPKVVILDYVIGDYTTGLDLLTTIKTWEEQPAVIFLTDEPSVQVAVDAMKFGARDYLLTDNPEAIQLVCEQIQKLVRTSSRKTGHASSKKPHRLKNLVAVSPTSIKLLDAAKSIAQSTSQLIIISGPAGCGKSALAEAIHNERRASGPLTNVDWNLYPRSANELFGLHLSEENPNRFGNSISIIIRNVQSDNGTLFKTFEKFRNNEPNSSGVSHLTICTTDNQVAKMWSQFTELPILEILPLSKRTEDIPALARYFHAEASEMCSDKPLALPNEGILFLSKQEWPGDIKQLRSCVIEATLLSAAGSKDMLPLLESSYERSGTILDSTSVQITPLQAQLSIEHFCGDYRLAALHLGTSVHSLYNLVTNPQQETRRTA